VRQHLRDLLGQRQGDGEANMNISRLLPYYCGQAVSEATVLGDSCYIDDMPPQMADKLYYVALSLKCNAEAIMKQLREVEES
jgi:hypothetical protein